MVSKRVVLADVPWTPKTGTRAQKNRTMVPKNRTRVQYFAKPPFHFPIEINLKTIMQCNRSENSRRLWLPEIRCWKSFPANFDAAGKLFTDFPAAQNAVPAELWAFSGKENGCWKIGLAFGNAPGFSLKPPQPS